MLRFSFNQCIVEGNVAATPEIRHTRDSSRPVSNFTIYVDSSYKSKKNQDGGVVFKKRTERIPVTVWAKLAEFTCKNVNKGDKVRVVGKIRTRTYENKEGHVVNSFEIVADQINIMQQKRDEYYED